MEIVMNMVVEMQCFPLSSDKMDVTSAGDSLYSGYLFVVALL
jgi:hypothetical protein